MKAYKKWMNKLNDNIEKLNKTLDDIKDFNSTLKVFSNYSER